MKLNKRIAAAVPYRWSGSGCNAAYKFCSDNRLRFQ